jgi:hypothetical protein
MKENPPDGPSLLTLTDAALRLGWASPDGLRMAFREGRLPPRFLIRVGRLCRVDFHGLLHWLRAEAQAREEAERRRASA